MVDLNQIGNRIREQRKYIRRVSQEKMAEDLFMYQADISNLEKAKNGSGITDIMKLDAIATYFNIPLETLLFGREDKTMLKYQNADAKLEMVEPRIVKETHRNTLVSITGYAVKELPSFVYGPYTLYNLPEKQIEGFRSAEEESILPENSLLKYHTYVFAEDELVGVMTAGVTTVMQHIFQPALQGLQRILHYDILDVTDTLRTLNPYWALFLFAENEEEQMKYREEMFKRMDELRSLGENRAVLYIESVYVREDSRHHGIFRMYIDLLKIVFGDAAIMWLNMEPTAGAETTRQGYTPAYTISDVGQMSMNASVAERVGFTIDPDIWHRQAECIEPDGSISVKPIEVRKCAYFLPAEIRDLLSHDGDLVAVGRAKQKISQTKTAKKNEYAIDHREGKEGDFFIIEWKRSCVSGPDIGKAVYLYGAHAANNDKYQFGVSHYSVLQKGLNHEKQLERYEYLDDAENSDYVEELININKFLAMTEKAINKQ